jgi:K+-sensing histidine kinase KdpD
MVFVEFNNTASDAGKNQPDVIEKTSSVALSACYGIIQDHEGRILSDHLPLGGSRIRIELPCGDGSDGFEGTSNHVESDQRFFLPN